MKILLKYWYIILFAFLLSAGAAAGILYMRRAEWMPPPVDPLAEARERSTIANMSDDYIGWNFEIVKLEDIRTELAKERDAIKSERQELESLRSKVEQETAEMMSLRDEIDDLRNSVREEFTQIGSSEEANLKSLARIYTEMKPGAIVTVFRDMNEELVVKIMSMMPAEAAAGILEEMTKNQDDNQSIERAALITDELRKLQK